MSSATRTVWAAGAVLWRISAAGKVEVAVVHRKRYDDWSLPKGKAHDGELLVATAAREVTEETGHDGRIGRALETVSYSLKPGVRKKVAYWSMESTGGRFVANHETDDIQWLSVDGAQRTVSYGADRKVLKAFAAQDVRDLHQLVVVRHAKAGRRTRFSGDDTQRPLDDEGEAQAEALVGVLGLYGVRHLHAADRLRCVQTLVPLSQELRADIVVEPALTEEAYAADPAEARERLRTLAAPVAGVRVVCSQGRAIAPLLKRWAADDQVELPASRNRKGSVWILTLRGETLIQADHLPSPFPGKNGH
ncbi:NUDIX hydrolase [Gordonia sp. PP30]|uniref:NUDIX hydrolase n=1 Tax=unclassified Gordonia (in: high G+C Gram-positive bacteria) TaxID=2657482 RepID=UPI0020004E9E|nr:MULTISPECIES: NUDIX hydrolase [unclassified Gordonia (in: high G+C Gram-positive bacteria)]UQE73905.1 NUDIX hydrolase [Gordonia sp. PP30]